MFSASPSLSSAGPKSVVSDSEGFLSKERAYPTLRPRAGREGRFAQEQHPMGWAWSHGGRSASVSSTGYRSFDGGGHRAACIACVMQAPVSFLTVVAELPETILQLV